MAAYSLSKQSEFSIITAKYFSFFFLFSVQTVLYTWKKIISVRLKRSAWNLFIHYWAGCETDRILLYLCYCRVLLILQNNHVIIRFIRVYTIMFLSNSIVLGRRSHTLSYNLPIYADNSSINYIAALLEDSCNPFDITWTYYCSWKFVLERENWNKRWQTKKKL